jgi:hypothetical protein
VASTVFTNYAFGKISVFGNSRAEAVRLDVMGLLVDQFGLFKMRCTAFARTSCLG